MLILHQNFYTSVNLAFTDIDLVKEKKKKTRFTFVKKQKQIGIS